MFKILTPCEDGSVKPSAEITGGYVSDKAEIGEMWLNR